MKEKIKLIDAHHHLWNPISANPDIGYQWLKKIGKKKQFGDPTAIQRDYLFDEFTHESKKHELLASVHVQSDGAILHPVKETAWIDAINKQNSFAMVSVGFVDLAKENADQIIFEHKKYASFRGIRQIIGFNTQKPELNFVQEDLLKNQLWKKQFQLLHELNLSFDLQLYPEQILLAAEFLAKHETIPIVIDHAASPYDMSLKGFRLWERNLEQISQLKQVFIKLSGFGMYQPNWNASTIKDYFQTIYELFSTERMMFGSNFPVDKLMQKYDFIIAQYAELTQHLPISEQNNFFYKTAQKFYRIAN